MSRRSISCALRIVVVSLLALLHGLVAASPAAAQLAVAIEANPGVAVPGEQLDVRITVSNQGAANVGPVLLNLPIPAELDAFLGGIATPVASGCNQVINNAFCETGETLTWNLATILAGQSITVSLSPIVSATAIGPIVFSPALNSGPSASATVSVDAGLSLDVSLFEAEDSVAAGGALAYTIHFGNRSTIDPAPNALLRLPLPAGTTFGSASDGGGLNAGAVEWSLGTLQPGQSGTRRVTLTTAPGLVRGQLILANALLSDSSPQTAEARAVTEIDGLETLALGMVVGPDPVAPGEQLAIELTVRNTSAAAISTVTLVLRWPQEIASLLTGQGTDSPSGCTQIVNNGACTGGEFSSWSLGALEPGQTITVSYSANLAAIPDGSIVDFRATALSSGLDDRSDVGRAVVVDAASGLDVALNEVRNPVAAGDALAYTIHFGNRSTTDAAPSALLRLPLPDGTTFVSASDAGALNGSAVEWSLGTLAPGQSGTRSVTLLTSGALVRGALLEANVQLSDASIPSQLARASALAEIDGLEALLLGMVVGPDPAAPGEQLAIELTVSNTSAATLSAVTLALRWPHEIASILTGQGTGSPVGCNQIVNNGACTAGEFTIWSLGAIGAGQTITVSYSGALAATADGSIVELEAIAQNAANDDQARVGRAIAVDASPTLDVQVHPAVSPVAAGSDLAYTIHFGNRSSTDAAPNAQLRFALPAGTTFVSASDGGALVGGAVEWSLGNLQPGQSGTRSVGVATSGALARGKLVEANVLLLDTSAPAQLARASASTEIDGVEALALALVVGPDPVAAGEQLAIELVVSNTSASALSGVSLILRWPQAIASLLTGQGTFAPVGCNQIVNNGACTAGEFSVWSLGTLNAGQSITVSYSGALAATPDGSIVEFLATVQTSADDQARAERAIAVDADRPLELVLAENVDPIAAGDDLVYTLAFVNRSRTYTAPNALLRFPLPVGATFGGASNGGAINAGTVEWSLGTIGPGQTGTRTATIHTNGTLPRASLLRAEAMLADSALPPGLARAQAVSEIDGVEALATTLDFTLDFTDWAYRVDIAVTNDDVVNHTNVSLSWRVPRNAVTFARASVVAVGGGCNQILNNAFCEAGEFLSWTIGTLTPGQTVTLTIPNLYVAVPSVNLAEAFSLEAITVGTTTDDGSVDIAVPEPRGLVALVAGMVWLVTLGRLRRRTD